MYKYWNYSKAVIFPEIQVPDFMLISLSHILLCPHAPCLSDSYSRTSGNKTPKGQLIIPELDIGLPLSN